MQVKSLSLLTAIALPAYFAYKKYQENSDYYDQKFNKYKAMFSKENWEELKLSETQKRQSKEIFSKHKQDAESEFRKVLNPTQKDLYDKMCSCKSNDMHVGATTGSHIDSPLTERNTSLDNNDPLNITNKKV